MDLIYEVNLRLLPNKNEITIWLNKNVLKLMVYIYFVFSCTVIFYTGKYDQVYHLV